MIAKGSRYEGIGAVDVTAADGSKSKALKIRFIPPTPAGFLHTVKSGERLDLLAYNFYRNAEKFWLIADANSAMDPDDLLEPGLQLRIPPDRTV